MGDYQDLRGSDYNRRYMKECSYFRMNHGFVNSNIVWKNSKIKSHQKYRNKHNHIGAIQGRLIDSNSEHIDKLDRMFLKDNNEGRDPLPEN